MLHLLCAYTIKNSMKVSVSHIFWKNPLGSSLDIVCFIFSLFLVMAEAANLDGQFVKKDLQLHAWPFVTQHWSEFIQRLLRIVIYMFLLFSVTTVDSHLGLPSHINLKGPHLQIILIKCD